MNILINASNIRGGGGLQVADSICNMLNQFLEHRFFVVLSSNFTLTQERIKGYSNVKVYSYDLKPSFNLLLFGKELFLDDIVEKERIDAILTVFGPAFGWKPKKPYLCGYARPQLVLRDSPHYKTYGIKQKIKLRLLKYLFKRSTEHFYTENPYITDLLKKLLRQADVRTVTNYYNQVFDTPSKWKERILPKFEGCTIITISTYNPHKNFEIIPQVAEYLKSQYPLFNFRFVLTIKPEDIAFNNQELEGNILFLGGVDISECPSLYKQSNIMFMPSLMECFTATFPEAMRMKVPIVTTDLEFARGLCGDAARYYKPIDAKSAADAIYEVAINKQYAQSLIAKGERQLEMFDNYVQRADKLIRTLEIITRNKENEKENSNN